LHAIKSVIQGRLSS